MFVILEKFSSGQDKITELGFILTPKTTYKTLIPPPLLKKNNKGRPQERNKYNCKK